MSRRKSDPVCRCKAYQFPRRVGSGACDGQPFVGTTTTSEIDRQMAAEWAADRRADARAINGGWQ